MAHCDEIILSYVKLGVCKRTLHTSYETDLRLRLLMTDASTVRTRIHRPARGSLLLGRLMRLLRRILHPILRRVWYLNAPVVLMIHATPSICLHTLATAAKPSTQRLHHRNLFAQGRRYFVQLRRNGNFRVTTTSRVIWRYRQRTNSSAILTGTFSPFGDDITRIHLQSRISAAYILMGMPIPIFITSIIFYAPWNPAVIVWAGAALFTLSFLGRRYNAALEANEMVWFVQKVLDDLVPAEVMTLGADTSNTIYDNRDFEEAWRKFYDEHKSE
mgnify:CR=1 FL=1